MANQGESLVLHADQSELEAFQSQLQTALNDIDTLISNYQSAEAQAKNFIEDGDSNAEMVYNAIKTNIKNLTGYRQLTQKSLDNINDTIEDMTGMGTKISSVISEGVEAAQNIVESKINLGALGL